MQSLRIILCRWVFQKLASPKSQAFEALQSIVFDKSILKDKLHLTQFWHTGVLEVYHSLLNKWAPKSTHFSYKGMVAQSQLAAVDFNQIQNLEQVKTKDGLSHANVCFSKMTKTGTVKPIKEAKVLIFFSYILIKFHWPNSRSIFKEREIWLQSWKYSEEHCFNYLTKLMLLKITDQDSAFRLKYSLN